MASPARILNEPALAAAAKMANGLVGRPYRHDTKPSPADALDCWDVLRIASRELWGEELPRAPIDELVSVLLGEGGRRRWRHIEQPVHACFGLTSSTAQPRHVVVYLANDRGGVLHSLEGHGVVWWRPLLMLRAYGFGEVRWYVPVRRGEGAAIARAA